MARRLIVEIMSTKHDDQLALAHLALIDMERAERSVDYLLRSEDKYLKAALFRDAVISYAKPFLSNKFRDGTKGLRISTNHVPSELKNFHDEILALRDELVAHTDMTRQRPVIEKYEDKIGHNFSMTIKGYETIHEDHLVEPLLKLAKAVHRSLMNGRSDQVKNDF